MTTRVIKPPAALKPRNPNERLVTLEPGGFPHDLLMGLSCFEPRVLEVLRTFPQAIIVRFYRAAEVICYQDDPGYTAFYVLKRDEILKLNDLKMLPSIGDLANWPAQEVASVVRQPYGKGRKPLDPAYIGEGEIFGEMSCLFRTPR